MIDRTLQDLARTASQFQSQIASLDPPSIAAAAQAYAGTVAITEQFQRLADSYRFNTPSYDRSLQGTDHLQAFFRSLDNAAVRETLSPSIVLPDALETYRLDQFMLAGRLASQQDIWGAEWTRDFAESFQASAAIGQMMTIAEWVGAREVSAAAAFASMDIPDFSSISAYGGFLNAAGLSLGHWPSIRLLTRTERRRRLRQRIAKSRPSSSLRKAYDLTYRHEIVLRETIADAMEGTYGPDWARSRLPLCGCQDLLGRWNARGGDVLDHADFAHYERILSNPEHFTETFDIAFETPEIAAQLMQRARALRVASFHPGRVFTQADLRELRLVWRQIEVAMLALTPTTDFGSQG